MGQAACSPAAGRSPDNLSAHGPARGGALHPAPCRRSVPAPCSLCCRNPLPGSADAPSPAPCCKRYPVCDIELQDQGRASELSFATVNGVVAFLLERLKDPTVAAGARTEAAALAARNNPAAGAKGGQPAGKAPQRSAVSLQPPAKKQCRPAGGGQCAAGTVAGAAGGIGRPAGATLQPKQRRPQQR